jgi:hypothetical protein
VGWQIEIATEFGTRPVEGSATPFSLADFSTSLGVSVDGEIPVITAWSIYTLGEAILC